jgi:hypothetical protein
VSEARRVHWSYAAAGLGYVAATFVLSSSPADLSILGAAPSILTNLLHVPLYAGLASCLLLSATAGQWRRSLGWRAYVAIAVISAVTAAVNEWYQASVPGRYASVTDFGLNVVGILGLVLVHRVLTGRNGAAAAVMDAAEVSVRRVGS